MSKSKRQPPAPTPEAEEQRLISLATKLAAQQLEDGTASSQVITHYLKLGTNRERLEREKLERENELLKAKAESIKSGPKMDEYYIKVVNVMRGYRGESEEEDEQDIF